MNKKEQLLFAERCSILIDSGISLGEALAIISGMQKSKKIHKILNLIKEKVEKGTPFSKSLMFTGVRFDQTLIAMIENGENSGTLSISLRQAYETLEKKSEMKKKILGALMYPGFIAFATIIMTLFLVMYIFPKIIPLLSNMNITLPFLTRAVRYFYNFFVYYGVWLFLFLCFIFLIFNILYKKNKIFRNFFQKIFLFLPIIGESTKKYFINTDCRSMGVLLENGQSLNTILKQRSSSSSFIVYQKAWDFCHRDVEKGISLSLSMKSFPKLFPQFLRDMLYIGERTGSLSQMLVHISRMYERELDVFIKQLGSLLEPLLMILMGLIVGSVALSIILPIYEITNHLGK